MPGAPGRLTGRSSFARLRTSGVRVRRGPLGATVLLTDGPTRIGFALPTSLGNAVVRNRLRRQLRAIARSSLALPHADILIRPGSTCLTLSYRNLEVAFNDLAFKIADTTAPRKLP